MNLQTEIKWIVNELTESNDPILIKNVKKMIISMRMIKESSLLEQKLQDELMAEAEEDIKAGRVHTSEEVKKMVDGWLL